MARGWASRSRTPGAPRGSAPRDGAGLVQLLPYFVSPSCTSPRQAPVSSLRFSISSSAIPPLAPERPCLGVFTGGQTGLTTRTVRWSSFGSASIGSRVVARGWV